ncbi:MAG: 50S ribosomal protein L18 [Candidatus Chromulinivorax sp.]
MKQKKIQRNRTRRAERVHYKVKLTANGKPRIVVFRSLNHMYAQVIDDSVQKTIASSSTLVVKHDNVDKKQAAHLVGVDLAEKIKQAGIQSVCFDRSGFLYHGRVKSLVEGLRAGGLQI